MAKLFMYVGLSGSGKSSYKIDEEVVVVSSDALRAELYGDENDQTHNAEVFDELHRRVRSALLRGENVVFDATNLSSRRRKHFLKTISHIECEKTCIVFATPFEECVKRDLQRSRTVGKEVILKQIKQFQMPQFEEGWNDINIITVENDKKTNLPDLLYASSFIEHDNPHHLETIGNHLTMAYNLSSENRDSLYLMTAVLYHDIGKVFTKTFINSKGEETDIAHFYGHERVSAYLFATSHQFTADTISLKIIWLIENHMRPYFQGYEKWKEKQNKDLIKDLERLHKYGKLTRLT